MMSRPWRTLLGVLCCTLLLALPSHATQALDGVDDQMQFGNLAAYDFADQSFTVVIYLSGGGTQSGVLLARRNIGSNQGGWFLRQDAASGAGYFRLVGVASPVVDRQTTSPINTGAFLSLGAVVTTNTSTAAGNMVDLYVNGGANQGSVSTSGLPYYACSLGDCTLTSGIYSDLDGGTTSWWGPGIIELIEIYQGALTAQEMLTAGKGQLARNGLTRSRVGLWPLDTCTPGTDSHGTTVVDRSGNGRHGQVNHGGNATGAMCYPRFYLSTPWGPQ